MSEDCLVGEECIGIRSCSAVVEQLQRAKATQDATKRNEIIQAVRDKVGIIQSRTKKNRIINKKIFFQVCGKRKERKVCCASSEQEPLQTFAQQESPKKIGTFNNIFHDIAGTAYALNSTTVLIKGFNYDGEGPDAFFLGGTHGRPSKSGEVFLRL